MTTCELRITIPLLVVPLLGSLSAPPAAAQSAAGTDRPLTDFCAEAAAPHLAAALLEAENVGGLRIDSHVDAALAADPGCPFAQALYAASRSGLTVEDRMARLDAALAETVGRETRELVAIAALREWQRGASPERDALTAAAARLTAPDPYFGLAEGYAAPDNAEIARRMKELIERNPDYAAAHNMMSYALHRSGRTAEALAAVEEYVRLLPRHPNPHDSHGELLQYAGRLDEAEAAYRRAVEVDPDFQQGYIGMAEVAQLRGDNAGARRHLESALNRSHDPAGRWPHLRALAFNAAYADDFEGVRHYLREAAGEAEKAGDRVAAMNSRAYLGFMEAAEGNADEAKREWEAARDLDNPNTPLGDAYIAAALGDTRGTAAAVAALQKNAVKAPALAASALPLARVVDATARGDVNAARAALDRIELPAFSVIGHAYLARALREAGDAAGEAACLAEVEQYRQVDISGAFAHRLVRR